MKLFISSVMNILLDLLFVLAFHWDVAGVVLAIDYYGFLWKKYRNNRPSDAL